MADRHSRANEPNLISDPVARARKEAENAVRQTDRVLELVDQWSRDGDKKRLRPSVLLELHRLALDGVHQYAGNYRPDKVKIGGSRHLPPPATDVARLVEDLCEYVNKHWDDKDKPAIHLAAYTLWRINWIHPFADGNGRTARAVSYLVLCAALKTRLPGTKTIPDQIAEDKTPYYRALEEADKAFKSGITDVSGLERLLAELLARQLVDVYKNATAADEDNGGDKDMASAPARPRPQTAMSRWRRTRIVRLIEGHPVIVTSIVAVVIALISALLS